MADGSKPKGKRIGFARLKAKIAAKGKVDDPAAVAASIGRKKYGASGMAKMAAKGARRARRRGKSGSRS